jgi:hypothetical protein
MTEEKVFFDEAGVSITSARMIYGNQTYTMSGVTSAESFEKPPSRIGAILLMLFGLLICLSGDVASIIVGLVIIVGGIVWWLMQKTEYSTVLRSSAGETKAYTSEDQSFVDRITQSVNDAIFHRGQGLNLSK